MRLYRLPHRLDHGFCATDRPASSPEHPTIQQWPEYVRSILPDQARKPRRGSLLKYQKHAKNEVFLE
jgi:hypothetical protein